MNGDYDDIIHLPHPVSTKHPRMSAHDRAAQFSPFAALTGYSDAIQETLRQTEQRLYWMKKKPNCLTASCAFWPISQRNAPPQRSLALFPMQKRKVAFI